MRICDLKPEGVFGFFAEISAIPHGSGNTEGLADYCMEFAKKRNLKAVKDGGGNVIIFSEGTNGREKSESVILQGHLDMVCEKNPDCALDMQNEPITLCTDGNYIWADGTTLGGDDGIAIAYILAVLDDPSVPHPPIEAVFTRDEEIGMLGAAELDFSNITGKRLINIDSEEEGVFTVSCAGGITAHCRVPLSPAKSACTLCALEIEIGGLTGGHSGTDIGKNRQNAAKLMGSLLEHINGNAEIGIARVLSGGKTNVIPQSAAALICADKNDADSIKKTVYDFYEAIKKKMPEDPSLTVSVSDAAMPDTLTDTDGTRKLIDALINIPNGVRAVSPETGGMVETSLNLGILRADAGTLDMDCLIRSNTENGKRLTMQCLKEFTDCLGGDISFSADYPSWEYRNVSPLRDIMTEVYEKMYAAPPRIEAIHAGLECGLFADKIADIDMVSIGPDIENIHTPRERMSVASVVRTWNFLLKILEKM
ncbi:MAG: aminoacyl-histidine dipeptidase [Oscillospiraceae bacterium]|nr:aminoacyl-histidine dipeptidase [Oscillospiraceae bacterium]